MKATLALIIVFLSHHALASGDLKELNSDLSELQLEQEAEEMELFDQDRHTERAIEERKALEAEANQLQSTIQRLKKNQNRNQTKLEKLNRRYDKSAAYAKQKRKEANKVRREHDALQARVNKVQTEVDQVEGMAVQAKNEKQQLLRDIKMNTQKQKSLVRRRDQAKRIVRTLDKEIRQLRATNKRLGLRTRSLENEVAQVESQVDDLKARRRALRTAN